MMSRILNIILKYSATVNQGLIDCFSAIDSKVAQDSSAQRGMTPFRNTYSKRRLSESLREKKEVWTYIFQWRNPSSPSRTKYLLQRPWSEWFVMKNFHFLKLNSRIPISIHTFFSSVYQTLLTTFAGALIFDGKRQTIQLGYSAWRTRYRSDWLRNRT